ncbi:hypothetical protein TNCV_2222221 [Trichonephila clavipes]|nr:hypothetical protein TNCV_2222221 [Trichonephila clavipes]
MLLARWIVRSVPLEIVGSSGHEKVPTRGKPSLERSGRPPGQRIEGSCGKQFGPHSDSFNDTSRRPFLNGLPGAIFHQDIARLHKQELLKTSYVIFRLFHGRPIPPICPL